MSRRYTTLPVLSLVLSLSIVHAAEDATVKPVAVLKGHTEAVYAIAFMPNSSEVLTGSFDRSIRLWDAQNGKEKQLFAGNAGHQNQVLSLSVNPKGSLFVSGGADNAARIWDLTPPPAPPKDKSPPKPATSRSLGHPNLVDAVSLQPQGTLLATGCHDGQLRIWDVAKGQQLKQIQLRATPPSTAIYSLVWTPDGKSVIAAGLDQRIQVYDPTSGNQIREFKDDRAALPFLLASSCGGAAGMYGVAPALRLAGQYHSASKLLQDKVLVRAHPDAIFCLALSPDGKLLASAGSDAVIKLWEPATGKLVGQLLNPALTAKYGEVSHPGWIYSLAFSPDGHYLVAGGNAPRLQGYLSVWDISQRRLKHSEIRPEGNIHAITVSPNGQLVGVACGPKETLAAEAVAYILRMTDLLNSQTRTSRN